MSDSNVSRDVLKNTKDIIALSKDVEYIRETVSAIMNNHLVHIANDVKDIQTQVAKINVKDAGDEPLHGILWEVFRYIIMGVVAALAVLIAEHNGL